MCICPIRLLAVQTQNECYKDECENLKGQLIDTVNHLGLIVSLHWGRLWLEGLYLSALMWKDYGEKLFLGSNWLDSYPQPLTLWSSALMAWPL